ncbi:putative integrase catalytic domain-containing protein [Phytophthora infestans]|uniref:Putative integrase catalytic domain-containing protein n=1 Tax=Phytophthora infestans TaxID=4787 RepID=A0A8S9V6G6_PHYIN|nr:putative integrase catalytic domain-containing protein [Phytophthora infestans]
MVKIIEAHSSVTLIDAKEMLRREFKTLRKRDKQEEAFNAVSQDAHVGRQGNNGRSKWPQSGIRGRGRGSGGRGSGGRGSGSRGAGGRRAGGRGGDGSQRGRGGRGGSGFSGQCFECHQYGHRRSECPRLANSDDRDEFVFAASTETSPAWILDSGASSHMTHDRSDFDEFRALQEPTDIVVASGQRLRAVGTGVVRFTVGNGPVIKVTEVLYVPDLDRRLLSIPSLVAKGAAISFDGDGCSIRFGDKVVAHVRKCGKLFVLSVTLIKPEDEAAEIAASALVPTEELWHDRLGHVSKKKLVLASRAASGIPSFTVSDVTSGEPCVGCSCGKMTVNPFSRQSGSTVKTQGLLDIVHSDVMGPMKPLSKGGARYVVTFVDDY